MATSKPCPLCRDVGKDQEGDNLFCYDNGVSWCHRHGIVSKQQPDFFRTLKGDTLTLGIKEDRSVHEELSGLSDEPHSFGLKWLSQYNVRELEFLRHGIRFIDKGRYTRTTGDKSFNITLTNCIYIPLSPNGSFMLRCDPEYSNTKVLNSATIGCLSTDFSRARGLVIVEDWVSAIKVNQVGMCGISLNGVKVKDNCLAILRKLMNKYNNIYIHLDDDEAGRQGTYIFLAQYGSMGYNIKKASTDVDPKCMLQKDLKELYK